LPAFVETPPPSTIVCKSSLLIRRLTDAAAAERAPSQQAESIDWRTRENVEVDYVSRSTLPAMATPAPQVEGVTNT
jgi:hypothetical protein